MPRVLVVLALGGQANSATTLDLFLTTSGDRPSYGAMVERRDGPSWLRDDDDDETIFTTHVTTDTCSSKQYVGYLWTISMDKNRTDCIITYL